MPGQPAEVIDLVQRILAHSHKKTVPDSLVEDWVRLLGDQPLASIWEIYERTIRSTEKWLPTVGQFLARVESHAEGVRSTAKKLTASIGGE